MKPLDIFISPNITAQLVALGVVAKTHNNYRVFHQKEWYLFSAHFDPLQLYKTIEGLPFQNSPYTEYPAFTLEELVPLIPGFCMVYENGQYTVCGDKIFDMPCVSDKKAVDAAGMLLTRCILQRILKVETINNSIKQTLNKEYGS